MAKQNKSKKKVIGTNKVDESKGKKAKKTVKTVAPPPARVKTAAVVQEDLLFGRQNYMWMLIGVAVIALGMLLMLGGDMPNSETWDESLIYSNRRTLLAPIVILIGLVIEFFAIFRN